MRTGEEEVQSLSLWDLGLLPDVREELEDLEVAADQEPIGLLLRRWGTFAVRGS